MVIVEMREVSILYMKVCLQVVGVQLQKIWWIASSDFTLVRVGAQEYKFEK